MATREAFQKLVEGLGLESDCPLCGQSWPNCQGACVAHETVTGQRGPFHGDYNDDCAECQAAYQGYWDADALLKAGVCRPTVSRLLCTAHTGEDYDDGVRERLAECDRDPNLPHVLDTDTEKHHERRKESDRRDPPPPDGGGGANRAAQGGA